MKKKEETKKPNPLPMREREDVSKRLKWYVKNCRACVIRKESKYNCESCSQKARIDVLRWVLKVGK